jgi:cytidylate kinase
MRNHIVAFDQGTTSSRTLLIDRAGQVVDVAQRPIEQHFPQPGWVEHDPQEILATQLSTFTDVLVRNGLNPHDVDSIGITNQRETTVVWDRRTGEPVCNAIVWQCRRTAPIIDELCASPIVRERITALLRSLTRYGDLVVEGRNITTAVFPDTPARFYLTASAEKRALRRQKEEIDKGIANQSAEEVKASLLARDRIDSTRRYAPLQKADGVLEIDSSDLTLDEVTRLVLDALPAQWRS